MSVQLPLDEHQHSMALAVRLVDYDRNSVVRLLSQQMIQNRHLEQQIWKLQSHIQQVEYDRRDANEMVDSFEQVLPKDVRLSNSHESEWQKKYMKLSAYVNESIKQAADLAEEYNRNLQLIRQQKKRIQHLNSTFSEELGHLKAENDYLIQQLSQRQAYQEQTQSRLHSELTRSSELSQQLNYLQQKYQQVKSLTRQIISRYEVVEGKCLSLEQERTRLTEIGKQYKHKVEDLQRSVGRDIAIMRNDVVEELTCAQKRQDQLLMESYQQLNQTLKHKISENNVLKAINKQLSEKISNESPIQNKNYEAKCNQIALKIERFWHRSNKENTLVAFDENQSRILKPINSQKTITTSASGILKDCQTAHGQALSIK